MLYSLVLYKFVLTVVVLCCNSLIFFGVVLTGVLLGGTHQCFTGLYYRCIHYCCSVVLGCTNLYLLLLCCCCTGLYSLVLYLVLLTNVASRSQRLMISAGVRELPQGKWTLG